MLNKLMGFCFICAVLIRSSFCEDVCNLPSDVGLCRGSFPKYYYDSSVRSCKKFYYGGCGGNGNRFDSLEQCQAACETRYTIGPVLD